MESKRCFKCKRIKKLDCFYVHSEMADGHLNKCKSCTKRDTATRYADPTARERIRQYERIRFRDPKRKAKVKLYAQRRRKKYRGKDRARQRLGNAVRDRRIIKQPCEICGDTKTQGHHIDYRKPLEVRWLCFKHHREAHGQTVGTL